MTKKAIFLKFQFWVCSRFWPMIDRNVTDTVRSSLLSRRKFFYHPISKIDDSILKKHTPPKKGPFFWGGG